jgi:hypothetical protein
MASLLDLIKSDTSDGPINLAQKAHKNTTRGSALDVDLPKLTAFEHGVNFRNAHVKDCDQSGTFRSAEVTYILRTILSSLARHQMQPGSDSTYGKSLARVDELKMRYGLTTESMSKLYELLSKSAVMDSIAGKKRVTDIISLCSTLHKGSTFADIRNCFFNDYVKYGDALKHVNTVDSELDGILENVRIVIRADGVLSNDYVVDEKAYDLKLICRVTRGKYSVTPCIKESSSLYTNNVQSRVVGTMLRPNSIEYQYYLNFINKCRIAAHNNKLKTFLINDNYNEMNRASSLGLTEIPMKLGVDENDMASITYLEYGATLKANLIFQTRFVDSAPGKDIGFDASVFIAFDPLCSFISWAIEAQEGAHGHLNQGYNFYGAFGGEAPLGTQINIANLKRSPLYQKYIKCSATHPHNVLIESREVMEAAGVNFREMLELRKFTFAVYVLEHVLKHGRAPDLFTRNLDSGGARTPPLINAVILAITRVASDHGAWASVAVHTLKSRGDTPIHYSLLDACMSMFSVRIRDSVNEFA